jgi:hypothetical protein
LLKDKRALLIVDDVWESDAAIPFKVGGPDCVTLITTRRRDLAYELGATAGDVYLLDKLSEEKAFELFAQLAPTVVDRYANQSHRLVVDLEGLPLALRVAGRLLELEASASFDITTSFKRLGDEADLLRAKAPDDRFDPQAGTTPTISLLLRQSTDRLDPQTLDCFALLGAFAPKPATFDLDAMRGVWQVADPTPTARTLVDRGLLEPLQSLGRFWMHSILVLHASALLDDETS